MPLFRLFTRYLTVVSTVIFPEMMSARICSSSDLVSAETLESKSWNSERSTPLFLRVPTYGSEEKEPSLAALMTVEDGHVHALLDRGDDHVLVLRCGDVTVGVHPDGVHLAVGFLHGGQRPQPGGTSDRKG